MERWLLEDTYAASASVRAVPKQVLSSFCFTHTLQVIRVTRACSHTLQRTHEATEVTLARNWACSDCLTPDSTCKQNEGKKRFVGLFLKWRICSWLQLQTYQPACIARHGCSQDGVAAVWGHSAIWRKRNSRQIRQNTGEQNKMNHKYNSLGSSQPIFRLALLFPNDFCYPLTVTCGFVLLIT